MILELYLQKSQLLKPGTKLRYRGGRGPRDVVTLSHRKDPGVAHPGWWCVEGGGLADYVINDKNSEWEIIDGP